MILLIFRLFFCICLFFFFFQAEDGIRDSSVTGVQTYALPISADRRTWLERGRTARGDEPCPGKNARPDRTANDRRRGRAVAGVRRSLIRATVRSLCQPARRPAWRGQPRHVRILPRPGRDQAGPARGSRV